MRVVNADKIIEKLVSNFPYELDIKQYESIWGVPIIEAIPIEFIEQWSFQNQSMNYGNGRNCILKLLKDWEKENEAQI